METQLDGFSSLMSWKFANYQDKREKARALVIL
jgi:hypothetical protein